MDGISKSAVSFPARVSGSSTHYDSDNTLLKPVVPLFSSFKREYFRNLKILPIQSQYIFSLALYVATNKNHFIINYEIHGINTRNRSNLHKPLSCLTSKRTLLFWYKSFPFSPQSHKGPISRC
jgi:hypothetical protein